VESVERLGSTLDDNNKVRPIDSEAVQYYKTIETILHKQAIGAVLDKNDLRFVYEIDGAMAGFEGKKDQRVAEIRRQRNRQADIETLCDCPPENIATDANNITETTQVFCNDTGSKISFVDFREEKNKQKLPQIIEFTKAFKETGSPAHLDVAIEGGIVKLNIDQKTLESLRTYETAIAAYKAADGGSPSYIYDSLKNIPWTEPSSETLNVHILNHDTTTPQERDKMVADMDRAGYRALTFSELVALGIIRPDLNKRNEILNTYEKHILGGVSRVPYLSWDGDERRLSARHSGSDWREHVRFLFVRK